MYNMGVSYLSDAVFAVDIYFMGSSEPYTVTTNWNGAGESASVTSNKFTVDLLDLDPELGAKTVRAFVLRPYSNVSLSPSGYNTSSTADHYIYFRLLNAGFYSTVENVGAATSDTHAEVNKFTEVVINNVPETVTVGTVIDPSTIEIVAFYSDATQKVVDNTVANLNIPEFDKPGIYKVTADYRGYHAEEYVYAGVDASTASVNTLPNKTLYYVGQMFNPEGLSFKYMATDGTVVVDSTNYQLETVLFDTVGTYNVSVGFCGQIFNIEVKVIPETSALVLSTLTDWTLDSSAKKLYGVEENTTVANVIAAFSGEVTVYDRAGNDITADTEALVGTGYTVATLYNGDIADYADIVIMGDVNGNGRIDTNDYVLIKRAYLNIVVISKGSDAFNAADINGNGTIYTNDYLQIKNH